MDSNDGKRECNFEVNGGCYLPVVLENREIDLRAEGLMKACGCEDSESCQFRNWYYKKYVSSPYTRGQSEVPSLLLWKAWRVPRKRSGWEKWKGNDWIDLETEFDKAEVEDGKLWIAQLDERIPA